jgi:hypothetical protein
MPTSWSRNCSATAAPSSSRLRLLVSTLTRSFGSRESYDAGRAVTSSFLRWLEALDTDELPAACDPDADGVTWMELFEDWR